MPHFDFFLALIIAYLVGSLSSAVLVCRWMGLSDPRTQGSKNPGATNVLRMGGKKAALLTLAGDTLKGVIPVLAAKVYGLQDLALSAVALSAMIGHIFPLFFHFRGGKGVATFLGAAFALTLPLGTALIVTWLITAVLFRFSSLAALVMAFCAPFYAGYFIGLDSALVIALMSLLLILRHVQNIQNLIHGTENRIGAPRDQSCDGV